MCPSCGALDSRVSRTLKGRQTLRERNCPCGVQWSTIEMIDPESIREAYGVIRRPIPLDVIKEVISRDEGACRYCGTVEERIGIDHVIPLCAIIPPGSNREAETAYRNSAANLVACCSRCNSAKSDRSGGKRMSENYNRPSRPVYIDTPTTRALPAAPNSARSSFVYPDFPYPDANQARNPSKLQGGMGGDLFSDRNTRGNLDLVARSGSRTDLDLTSLDPPAPVGALRLASSQAVAAKKVRRARVAVNPVYSEAFKAFWAKYPGRRKSEPDVCWELWEQKGLESIAGQIMAALDWQVEDEEWTKDGGQYVPAPTRYLRRHRWKAEQPGTVKRAAAQTGIERLVAAARRNPVAG